MSAKILNLYLNRYQSSEKSTEGELFIKDKFFCYTLEDVHRPVKVMHETCIPAGKYRVLLTYSNRFKRIMPLICNVPGFEGIRIHNGRTAAHTSGCPLVGFNPMGEDEIGDGAFDKLFEVLNNHNGIIYITIKDAA